MQVVCGSPLSEAEATLLLEALFQLYLTLFFVHHVSLSCVCVCVPSCPVVSDSAWALAHEPPLSMEVSRQEYWSGSPFTPPGTLLDPGTEPESLVSGIGGRIFHHWHQLGHTWFPSCHLVKLSKS